MRLAVHVCADLCHLERTSFVARRLPKRGMSRHNGSVHRFVVIAMMVGASGAARADSNWQWGSAPKRVQRSVSTQIEDNMTELGRQVGAHLGKLSLDTVEFRIDGAARRAQLGLGRRATNGAIWLGGDVQFADGGARIDASIEVGFGRHRLNLDLPTFELVPRADFGAHYVELRLPLLERAF